MSLHSKPSPKAIPQDTYADLVDSLFGTTASFYAGVLGGLIVPAIAFARTGQGVFIGLAAAMCGVTAYRMAIFNAYRVSPVAKRRENARRWEILYAVGGIVFMLAVGATGAILFRQHADPMTTIYGIVVVLGCAGAIPGRNAARPSIVLGQVAGLLLPPCLAFWLELDGWHIGLSVLMLMIFVSVVSTTKFLNAYLLTALIKGREAKIQTDRLDTALNNMSQGLCMADAKGVLSVVNSRFPELFGIKADLVGMNTHELADEIVKAKGLSQIDVLAFIVGFDRHINKAEGGVFTATLGEAIFDFRCDPMDDGGLVIVAEDVTETRLASRKIEHMALFDTLTGLPNRIQFRDRMQAAFDHSDKSGLGFSVLYVDLDLFKEVNDTLGHPIGDRLLREVAKRLEASFRSVDLVARFGGDEFLILMTPTPDVVDLDSVSNRLIAALSAPYEIAEHTIVISACIGVASAPRDGVTADEIIKNADMALYHAKAQGRGCFRRFSPSMDEQAQRKRQIESDLRQALVNDELEVFYQPIVDIRTGRANAFEALLRWRHPSQGLISPAVFVPVAEETGMIVEIGEWVLNRACRDAASWPDNIRVAVNFSAIQFRRSNICDVIMRALAFSGLAANRLEVEVTETIVIQDTEATLLIFRELAALGVRLALDDFGTGYSSLSYLNRFPFDKIKIDRAFVKDLNDPKSLAVITAVMHLAKDLGMSLVVEGVETSSQLALLTARGVHEIQGFLFSRPAPLSDIMEMTRVPFSSRLSQAA
jgi:diguanylate cyclase (GGDEF)-like protein